MADTDRMRNVDVHMVLLHVLSPLLRMKLKLPVPFDCCRVDNNTTTALYAIQIKFEKPFAHAISHH